jgi:RsiW-degrading membrane proteinase PrsW (M82 family)
MLLDFGAYVFTGLFGSALALAVESFWVTHGARAVLNAPYLVVSAPAYVLFIGLTEEFAKQIAVLLVALVNRAKKTVWPPVSYMMVGVSSGLGFSATENISYVQHGIFFDALRHGIGLGTMIALSRALYTPFLHAIWAGTAAFGVGVMAEGGLRRWPAALGLFALAAAFHGIYDATLQAHAGLALLDVAGSYLLFLSLLLNHHRQKRMASAAP